ncbi:MAG: RnfABCDGE type electron transport complex subunit D [Deferrisomatales bacterium]
MQQSGFVLTSSPHVTQGDSIPRIMWTVVAALAPAGLWGVYAFGPRAAGVMVLSVVACAAFEAAAQALRGRAVTVGDGSAALTGLLLAMNLPASSPWWLVVVGAAVAILLGKQVFGGLGQNPFNPALVARVVLLVSFPVQMTHWAVGAGALADAVAAATPLGEAKTAVAVAGTVAEVAGRSELWRLAVGLQRGCLGEVSEVALLLGAALLLWRRVISWDIPLGFVLAVVALTGAAWLADPQRYLNPAFHLVTGGLVLGAFYMATDMVTSPLNRRGRWVFGVGCGVLTAVIRLWGGYPEGVSFSILLMNACVPLIDRATKPRKFGLVPRGGTP